MEDILIQIENIKSKIFTLRGIQVMLDRDLAELYQTETRTLKQAVNRNKDRFPLDFMFVLDEIDIQTLVSQFVIPSKSYFGGAYPYAFTEQGVAMLSSIIKTEIAVKINIRIIRAFVEMRKSLLNSFIINDRIERIEFKQLETDSKLEQIFFMLNKKNQIADNGIFFDGQLFDAYNFVSDLIRSAQGSIYLIDNYIDDSVLTLFAKRKAGVKVRIYTKTITKQIKLDIEKFNEQYEPIEIIEFNLSHDRFLIIDEKELYHFGASLKDLGKKWFAFSKMDINILNILEKIESI